ncbi:LysM peptidoglycan-binding domain-containing protein [[Phormidium ambiguum] IAM M-71]|nr:LysM peptidoglycan-binding domain-containing protein [Phormidium ambiguum]
MARQQGNPPITHIIENGDILFDLAQAYYGDGNKWELISKANDNIHPSNLSVGQAVEIPPCDVGITGGSYTPPG